MKTDARIFVAGDGELIGAAIVRALKEQGFTNVEGDGASGLELRSETAVWTWFEKNRPEYVIHAAGKSGGISANQTYPADLMIDNLLVNNNLIRAAHEFSVTKLLYLASSCSYPRECPQPMKEEYLFTGPVEPTNEAYAMAKLAGLSLCRAFHRQYGNRFICGLPANAFGPEDDFSPEDSHVIAALIRRMHSAKAENASEVVIWGTGEPRREFIDADDLASACLHVMEHYEDEAPINLGGGEDVSIRELAERIREVVAYSGKLVFDTSKPDGMPRKGLDSSRLLSGGWKPAWTLNDSLKKTYQWYLENEHVR